jgi:membrane-bound lytic murein transglycosylase D
MLKQKKVIILLGSFCLYFAGLSIARTRQDSKVLAAVYTDSTSKDSASTVNPDLKVGFKNLLKQAFSKDDLSGAKLNPMAVSYVEKYIAKNKHGYESMKDWGKPYLDMMDNILEQHGIPKEMKYLSVIESGLKPKALSRAGARGPWAFMATTAQLYGLRVSKYNDERTDFFKSTHAAASMLTDLYQKYGDWLLVIAAYNSGPGPVDRAIKKSGSKDFWTIQHFLPNESMNHVKKFIGVHYIFEGEGGVTTLTKEEVKDLMMNSTTRLSQEEMNKSTAYDIVGRFNSAVILKYIDMDAETFNRYNPNFDNSVALNGKYNLRLPIQKMNVFIEKRYQILEESMNQLLKTATN